ncbi:MAG: CCA tRNA nucleotidyltransferase [Oligosphaeraceae bacterium]
MTVLPALSCPEEPLAILRTLQQAGYQAVLAGGCVRDMLLGRTPHDWDIATSARPEQVEALFPQTIPVGRQFGIILVLAPSGTSYEVASFRGESTYSDGRHPDGVRFVEMEEDVKRRDFTVNALLYDPVAQRIHDFVGGQEDLSRRLLRCVGEPMRRFQEDRLRLLRAIRFTANLGFTLEDSTWQAVCQNAGTLLPAVSQERIREELEKMLLHGASRQAFSLLEQSGHLREVLPELEAEKGVAQPPQFHPEGDVWQHQLKILGFLDETLRNIRTTPQTPAPETRFNQEGRLQEATQEEQRWLAWGALLHDIGKPPTYQEAEDRIRFNGHDVQGETMTLDALKRLRMDNTTLENAAFLVRRHMEVANLPLARIARQRRTFQHPLCPLLLELLRIDTLSSWGDLELHRTLVQGWREEQKRPHPPKPYINGTDLLERGYKTGPVLGKLLQSIHDYELEHPFASREDALAWLEETMQKP